MQRYSPVSRIPVHIWALAALVILLLACAMAARPANAQEEEPSFPAPSVMTGGALPSGASLDSESDTGGAAEAAPSAPLLLPDASFRIFAPLVSFEHNPIRADRIGFTAGVRQVNNYPDIRSLNAGWYVNWGVSERPQRPGNIEFVQMIRVHQEIDTTERYNATMMCGIGVTADRRICPYSDPHDYVFSPSESSIVRAARANPGSLWLIGNEMDRVDWIHGRQDEMLPGLYAVAYHDLSSIIRAADPTARIAIGGVIQATPLRLQYLTTVWETYRERYGHEMQVDVWNVHNFIAPEFCRYEERGGRREWICYNMGIPPGADLDEAEPSYLGADNLHINRDVFEDQIRAMRAWMKSIDEEDKPLIVSEYGVLHQDLCPQTDRAKELECEAYWERRPGGYDDFNDAEVIHDFMLWTFRFFASERDCRLSSVDNCRLVQRWAWFSLEDVGWNFNSHAALYVPGAVRMSEAGELYTDYANSNWRNLRYTGP